MRFHVFMSLINAILQRQMGEKMFQQNFRISEKTASIWQNIGLEELVQLISNHIYQDYVECTMLIPYTEGALVSYFNENATVKATEYEAEGTKITMSCLLKDLKKYKEYVIL